MSAKIPQIPECMIPGLRAKAEKYQEEEEARKKLDHISNDGVIQEVHSMILWISERKKGGSFQKMTKKFSHFCQKYPTLARMIWDRPEQFRIGSQGHKDLIRMLEYRQKLIDNPENRNSIEADLSQELLKQKGGEGISSLLYSTKKI